jgi:hypothetical protein
MHLQFYKANMECSANEVAISNDDSHQKEARESTQDNHVK